ncbi:hypothetical protein QWY85_15610 [Neolewinella lacunae]|uniref:DoxX family protein n=1 Tax=Neolewinella lacunae TaxID=1517758 RepID=A0A923TBP1_9BACT|nr:hypothetical protein [Neolewinella lacunae]MBC6992817.1 hypothetical protein [Neolewinella lacunae]MDN3636094.1 hypothetical protein [Neolewinella lacunae]
MTIFLYVFAIILLAAGAYHFYNPGFYHPFMPEWFPKSLANTAGGLAELLIGAGLLLPVTRPFAVWAALALMVVFLPLHVIDLLRERPVIGSKLIAVVRLLLQFALIAALWLAARESR